MLGPVATKTEQDVWDDMERVLQHCVKNSDGHVIMPCMRWNSFDRGYGGKNMERKTSETTPTLDYVLQSHRCASMY